VRTGGDVAGGEDVPDRRAILVVDNDQPFVIALAAQLHTEVIGWILADRKEDALAFDGPSVVEDERSYFRAV
jgi:hypothetical protein